MTFLPLWLLVVICPSRSGDHWALAKVWFDTTTPSAKNPLTSCVINDGLQGNKSCKCLYHASMFCRTRPFPLIPQGRDSSWSCICAGPGLLWSSLGSPAIIIAIWFCLNRSLIIVSYFIKKPSSKCLPFPIMGRKAELRWSPEFGKLPLLLEWAGCPEAGRTFILPSCEYPSSVTSDVCQPALAIPVPTYKKRLCVTSGLGDDVQSPAMTHFLGLPKSEKLIYLLFWFSLESNVYLEKTFSPWEWSNTGAGTQRGFRISILGDIQHLTE